MRTYKKWKREVAKVAQAHAISQGFNAKAGRPKDDEPSYTAREFMQQFDVHEYVAKKVLACTEKSLKLVSVQYLANIADQLRELSYDVPKMYSDQEQETRDLYEGKTEGQDEVENPLSLDREGHRVVGGFIHTKTGEFEPVYAGVDPGTTGDSNISLKTDMTEQEHNKLADEIFGDMSVEDLTINKTPPKRPELPPELSNDVHVSNRLYRVEALVKEVADMAQNLKENYRNEALAAWTLMQTIGKAKGEDFPEPIYADFFKERTAFVEMLSIIIDRLNKI